MVSNVFHKINLILSLKHRDFIPLSDLVTWKVTSSWLLLTCAMPKLKKLLSLQAASLINNSQLSHIWEHILFQSLTKTLVFATLQLLPRISHNQLIIINSQVGTDSKRVKLTNGWSSSGLILSHQSMLFNGLHSGMTNAKTKFCSLQSKMNLRET